MQNTRNLDQENDVAALHHHLLCWKSVTGGVLIALLGLMMASALGAGIAGFSAETVINRESSGSTIFSAAGLWLGLSVVLALFCGSYFAVRVSRFKTNRIGAAHGFVVSAIFFLIVILGAGHLASSALMGIGKIAQGAGDTASTMAGNSLVQDSINKALVNSGQLKSPPSEVAQGLATRLIAGDTESAKSYYAYQTGLSSAEVDAKFNQMKADFESSAKAAGEKTAHAIGDTGWALFILLLAGTIASVFGGRTAAHSNNTRPFAVPGQTQFSTLANQRGSVAPYIIGWLLGVPVSILFLIAILRSIF